MNIPFNIPFTTGKEIGYIQQAMDSGQISGNGPFTKRCHELLEETWGIKKALLTTSCTDALEMCSLLLNISPGDEIIVPAYTFVSTALAFTRQGARIIFADSREDNPCIDEEKIEGLITSKTKVIVAMHYNGIPCEMKKIMELSEKYNLSVVEDAAHAFGSRYDEKLIGTIGHLGCFSFHETKIIHCGEGGLLAVNDEKLVKRAEVIWEKGTNRCDFHRGEVKKYEWIDTGSSFLMSDISAAFLYAQLKELSHILDHRKAQWELYYNSLKELENKDLLKLPNKPEYSVTNYSGFYLIMRNPQEREQLINKLNKSGIQALTHYLDLGNSPYILQNQTVIEDLVNENSKKFQDTLLRLPLYHDLSTDQIIEITEVIKNFFSNEVIGTL